MIEKELESLAPTILKSLGIVIIFLLSITMGLLPLKLKFFQSNLKITGFVNALSAGIFLSVSLIHLLPEAHETFQEHLSSKFPFAFLIGILSYTFILIIEKMAFDTHKWLEVHVHPDLHHHEHKKSFKQEKQEVSTFLVSRKEKYNCCPDNKEQPQQNQDENKNIQCNQLMEACSHDELLLEKVDANRKISKDSSIIPEYSSYLNKSMGTPHNQNNIAIEGFEINQNNINEEYDNGIKEELLKRNRFNSMQPNENRQTKQKKLNEHKSGQDLDFDEVNFKDLLNSKANVARTIVYHDKHRKKHDLKRKRLEKESNDIVQNNIFPENKQSTRYIGKLTPYILLVALSFHGIFEGIAIGLQTEMSQIANLLLAVSLHKWAEALTLGLSFSKNESRKILSLQMILIFSSTSPLGIGIGWALSQSSAVVTAAFMSISAGTFLYISASEVVVEEFSISKNKWVKLVFFLFGVAMIAGLWFLEEDI